MDKDQLSTQAKSDKQVLDLFDRDLSWLSFNERVLQEAGDESVPLYERIKFIAIYSSNMDEFYRVRFANIRRIARLDKKSLRKKTRLTDPEELTKAILEETYRQSEKYGRIYRDSIIPALANEGIVIYQNHKFRKEHREFIEEYFYTQMLSFLQPVLLDPQSDKELFLENKRLYHAVELEDAKANSKVAVVNIPTQHLGRFVALPVLDDVHYYAFIDDILRSFLPIVFQGYVVKGCHSIKLNRDAELYLENEFSGSLIERIKKNMDNRKIGIPSRFLYDQSISQYVLGVLMKKVKLDLNDMVPGGQYHSMFDHFQLPNPKGQNLEYPKERPISHPVLQVHNSVFSAVADQDIMLHFPYQRYDYILRFFNEATLNPFVEEVKITLYRVADDSHIVNALISAARNGKKVTVFVEAKARFDEENNLKWAARMQEVGIDVRFGSLDLKVHAKAALIIGKRPDGTKIKYAFLGTGNFNEKTAGIYADHALLTSEDLITRELDATFDVIFGDKESVELTQLLVSQINMVKRFKELISREVKNVENGGKGRIILKLNNIQDRKMISELYKAAAIGVEIILIIRAICCIKPVKNIRIVRIVDRYLEHARVYCFHNNGHDEMFMGSADWMERNLYRRIEVVFPVFEERLRKEINKCLKLQLNDNVKAVEITKKLKNRPVENDLPSIRAQFDFQAWLKKKI